MKQHKESHNSNKNNYKILSILILIFIIIIVLYIPINTTKTEKYNITEYKEETENYFENETIYIEQFVEEEVCNEIKSEIKYNYTEFGTVRSIGGGEEKITVSCSISNKEKENYSFYYRLYSYDSYYGNEELIDNGELNVPGLSMRTAVGSKILPSFPPQNYYVCEVEPIIPKICKFQNKTISVPKEIEIEKNRTISIPYEVEKEKNVTIKKYIISYLTFQNN